MRREEERRGLLREVWSRKAMRGKTQVGDFTLI
jgi:hypothetical protein